MWLALDAIDFGFTAPRLEIEVKATTGRERMHTLAISRPASSRETSESTLAFYPAEEVPVPVVDLPLPLGVSDLRFRSDFSSVAAVDPAPILARTL